MIYPNILDAVGNTPCIQMQNVAPSGIDLYVKAEFFNPGSSVKDRLALSIIESAEKSGALKPGQTVVEATSGNTGIGLAVVCATRNYPLVIVMPESASVERRQLMRLMGATVVITPAAGKGSGAYRKAKELVDANGWFYARQFENSANADIHEITTGKEIVDDFGDKNLTHWVSGYGTGGTFSGVARTLRKEMPTTRLILAEPDVAPLVANGKKQAREEDGSVSVSHPDWNPHPIQGWTTDFIPLVLQESVDRHFIDDVVSVSGPEAIHWSRQLARKEGVLTGISGGGTFAAAMKVATTAKKGSVILCMLPDTAERYLSGPLLEGIPETMSATELALSKSTPGYQLDSTS